ncbi:MAG: AAA family ATPase [Dehalococcoidia bacterium]|nr:AAA family ATPase [Dehalococcoidia bacterium]
MQAPAFEHNGGVYRIRFEEEMISVRMDRLKETGDSLTGEIEITTDAPGVDSFMHHSRLNLLSAQSRKTLSKHMTSRMALPDWDGLIESVCVRVVRKHREGQPLITVGNLPARDNKQRYRLAPMLVEKEANLVYAPGGSGKSYLSYFFGLLVQTGQQRCDLWPKKGPVLFLDFETSEQEADERIKSIRTGMDLADAELNYRRCFQPLAADIETIQRLALDTKAELVIVDSVGAACGGEPESATAVLAYFMALRSMGITTLSVDHVNKSNEKKSPFGSVYKVNCARSVWEIKKTQEFGSDRMTVGMFHRKVNQGRLLRPIGFELNWFDDGNALIIHPAKIAEDPTLSKELPLKDRISAALNGTGKGLTVKAIQEVLSDEENEVSEAVIRATLNRYQDTFVKLPDGHWGRKSHVE